MQVDWGTFTKPNSLQVSLQIAGDALRKQGYTIWEPSNDGDYMVIGGNNDVIVNVTCVPQNGSTWIAVTSYSNDAKTAELARNNVRTTIVNTVPFD